jgi:hypothetical protein
LRFSDSDVVYVSLSFPMHATYPVLPILLDLIALSIVGKGAEIILLPEPG